MNKVMSEPMNKIYARKTIVKEIQVDEANSFVKNYHTQSVAKPNTRIISIGLFSDDVLLGVAQFCTPRTAAKKREYTTELLRMCFKENYRVIGGASKMIKFYIKEYNPSDIFTYQDTTGENTRVYENCGFSLVKQDKEKKYLVKNGKTLKNVEKDSKDKISYSYATSFGPDNILKTSLGEVFDNGKRLTNVELFVKYCDYHVETTTGDKTYAWFNPNVSFYTYKITAENSDKYYYGVHRLNIPYSDVVVEDCLNDGYFGSGGNNKNNKFNNWKNKHKDSLVKDIVKIFDRKNVAYDNERILVGDLYKTDPLCLNSIEGGRYTGYYTKNIEKFSEKTCVVHGLTKFSGDSCCKCTVEKSVNIKECVVHGLTKHVGDVCKKCSNNKNVSVKHCVIHGDTKHVGDSCYKCVDSSFKTFSKYCNTHGLTKFVNDFCVKCVKDNIIFVKECDKHGLTKFLKNKCFKCMSELNYSMVECCVHGLTKHIGDSCCKCTAEKSVNFRECSVHGETKFVGDVCASCRADENIVVKHCEIHGDVKHIGSKCYLCRNNGFVEKSCVKHGNTLFSGGKCLKCLAKDNVSFVECSVHGFVKHSYGECMTCRSLNSIVLKHCVIHGETKHKGNSCCKCTSDKAAHHYHSLDKTNVNCSLCQIEIDDGVRSLPVVVKDKVKVCPLCSQSFNARKNPRQVFCSNPHSVVCDCCGKVFSTVPRKNKNKYYCSRSCSLSNRVVDKNTGRFV